MKKNTAFFMAVFMIVSIVAWGVVYFSVPVYASYDTETFDYVIPSFAHIPYGTVSDVNTNGAIIATNSGGSILRTICTTSANAYYSSAGEWFTPFSKYSDVNIVSDSNSNTSVTLNTTYSSKGNTMYYKDQRFNGYTFVTPNYNVYRVGCRIFDEFCFLFYSSDVITACSLSNGESYYCASDVQNNYYFDGGSETVYFAHVLNKLYIISKSSNPGIVPHGYGTPSFIQNTNTLYYAEYTAGTTGNVADFIVAPEFNTFSDMMNYFYQKLVVTPVPDPDPDPVHNPNPPTISGGITFALPPGYAADIYYGGESYTVNATRISVNKSSIFKINNRWWPYDNVLIAHGVISPLTANMDIYNSEDYDLINWNKSDPYNILRQSYIATYTSSGYDGHTIIANPVHLYGTSYAETGKVEAQQTPIKITVSDEGTGLTIRMWSLSDSVVDGVIHSTTIARYTKGGDGLWYDDNNDPVDPIYGGETDVESEQQATLDQFVQSIDDFFSGTWRHIRQFLNSAGKLPSAIVEMYSWLPEEFKAVIFSAFSIVMVVAILKVML